ncbi:TadE/TadG family type IV pilus assembly protein [Mesorhizobium sp.]|uniref:TadE/TadG family type IV pilus assembly protein n=1 Tax=Mesorhizobium sp. TaxID=1871066 RepID=UPI00122C11C1|nr:TadE/TadG family type IV pilus assembly protein [Mesorhizobium sp.]TIS89569.1 MAG: pilus assembly protein [Mesorhizobium sp.]
MFRSARNFLHCESGSFVPIFVIAMIPLIAAVGFSVDYTSAVNTRGNMQNALDAAILSVTTLPTDTAFADRQTKLQQTFLANGGQGTAKLDGFEVGADGTARVTASASFAMPTNFMQIARINTVPIGVASAVRKRPALVQTTFKIDKASGWWDKKMTLYGTAFGQTTPQKLMEISYVYNNYGDPKGYGTTTVSTINGSTVTQVQQQVCKTETVNNFNNVAAGAITQTGGGKKYVTTCTTTPASAAGAVVDVSLMDTLYMQMDVPSAATAKPPQPTLLKSNDPTTSNRLYLDGVEVANGKTVDIFTAVPCGQTSTQAWEDGGSATPAPVANADFFYTVTGKCNFSQRDSEIALSR